MGPRLEQPSVSAEPADAEGANAHSTEGKIDRQHELIARKAREIAHTRALLERQLGALKADVRAATRERQSSLSEHLNMLESHNAAELGTLDARTKERRAERDHADSVRRVRATNTIKRLGLTLRDAASLLQPDLPVLASASTTSDDLVLATEVRELVSLGTLDFPRATQLDRDLPEVPAIVPFIDRGHLVIETVSGPADAPDTTLRGLLTSIVAQTYAAAPPGQMVVTVFNPKSTKSLAGYLPTGATNANILKILPPTRDAFERALEEHLDFMVRAESSIGNHTSMGDLVRTTGQHEHQYRVLVILDSPMDWSTKAMDLLEKLMSAGAKAGLSVVLHRDPTTAPPDRVSVERLYAHASVARRQGDRWTLAVRGIDETVPFVPHAGVNDQEQAHLMRMVVEGAGAGSLPNIPFADLIDATPATSEHGLKVSMGRQGTQTTTFMLGDTTSNIQNVLVGGRAGSGKTNLLKVMIYSMAARYPRDELEFFLLDFKEGGDFIPFAGDGNRPPLPNVSVVSRDCDAEFGIAALRHFTVEMNRRSTLTSDNGVANIWDLRKAKGIVVPRWVLVVDEFQGMLAGSTNVEATELLENLVRKGRSFGLHVVLATQTLSGVKFTGSKDVAIFENTAGRIVLQLGPGEFTRFMSSGNDDGDQLRYRGQAIFNPSGGVKSENQMFVVARADNDHTLALQDELHRRDSKRGPVPAPFVYRGGESVSLAELVTQEGRPRVVDGEAPVWFGRQSTINARVAQTALAPVVGSHVALLGGDKRSAPSAIATLQSGVLSSVAAAEDPLDVLVLEDLIPQFRREALVDEWLHVVADLGARVVRYDGDSVTEFVDAVEAAAAARRRTLVVLLGAENTDFARVANDGGRWRALIRDLPRRNVNVIGYWTDIRDVPGGEASLRDDYKTMLIFGKNEKTVIDATRQPRDTIPVLGDNRTIAFSAENSQEGLVAVASIRQLDRADLDAFRSFAGAVGGAVVVASSATGAPETERRHVDDSAAGEPAADTPGRASTGMPPTVVGLPPTHLDDVLVRAADSTTDGATTTLGRGEAGTVVLTFGADGTHHALVMGRAAAGVSTVTGILLHSLLARYDATQLDVELIDAMEGGGLPTEIADAPQVSDLTVSTDLREVRSALGRWQAEIRRRSSLFALHDAGTFEQYRGVVADPLPRRILIINEFSEVLDEEINAIIDDIARTGHLAGVHLVLVSLLPTAQVPRENFLALFNAEAARVAAWMPADESREVIGSDRAATLARGAEAVLLPTIGAPGVVFTIADASDEELATRRASFREGA
ncbi:FtsK/SpoIIIE domain-containing protein [Microbacterium memoriense]|uniref:FtsK/SpoIIIE domain-containing protein n=1 Tax=Microbacterium memoriense TaxID=2978350 RepID=A0ABT2PFQ0_9MICO|nr:FtsK/SpoIIIE domain-containing protein [Microbacterium memoriense]MCT9002609.1 FtsK/SpoIIIE domain-containing protein [Microbacterium memoriense]